MNNKNKDKKISIDEKGNNTISDEIECITSKNANLVKSLLLFDVESSIKNNKFIEYSTENLSFFEPINVENLEKLYQSMYFSSEYLHLFLSNEGKFRFIISGLIYEMEKKCSESLEQFLDRQKNINELLLGYLNFLINILNSKDNEISIKNSNELYKYFIPFLEEKATERNLTDIVEFSCEDIFSLDEETENVFIRNLDYTSQEKFVEKLKNKLKINEFSTIVDDSTNIIADMLLTPLPYLLSGDYNDKLDIKCPNHSINVVKNLNWFLWQNCNNEETRFYFDGNYGRFRYCFQILIDKISKNYWDIKLKSIDKVIKMHKEIHALVSEIKDSLNDYKNSQVGFANIDDFNQLFIFVCTLMSSYDFLFPAINDFNQWCLSPYIEWETDFSIKEEEEWKKDISQ